MPGATRSARDSISRSGSGPADAVSIRIGQVPQSGYKERCMPGSKRLWCWVGLAVVAAACCGCDPQLQTTVENGVIQVASSFLYALVQAIIQLVGEQASAAIVLCL
jgi:hypothetical protein